MTNRSLNEYEPDVVTPPGETLEETLRTIGMSNAELANRIGKTRKHVGAIINHGSPITPTTAIGLERALGIPASFWINRERHYRESLARQAESARLVSEVDWLEAFPIREMISAEWIEQFQDKVEQLKELLRFFGVASPQQWQTLWLSENATYRMSKTFISKPEACTAWLRRGELEAQQIQCKPFNKKTFLNELQIIRKLTLEAPEKFAERTITLCARSGVAVVFVPNIKGVPAYGATRWLTPDKALIQLTVRGRFEDILWFTFFHEAGHILLHGKKDTFIEGEGDRNNREQEADHFAQDLLIPPHEYQKFIDSRPYRRIDSVNNFAARLEISPATIVGRLQHDNFLPPTHMNKLRRRFVLKK